MKTKMLLAFIGLCSLVNVYAQTSSCDSLRIQLDRQVYCWNDRFTLSTNNDTSRNFFVWRRDTSESVWRRVSNFSCGVNGSIFNQSMQQLGWPPNPFPTMPSMAPAVFDLVISTSSTNPFANNACFSNNIIRNIVINPIPTIIQNPNNTARSYCKNSTYTDTLWCSALGPDSVINTNLTFQWYSSKSINGAGGIVVSGATNRFFLPPTTFIGGGISTQYYYCNVKNVFGCGINSGVSGLILVSDTTRSTTRLTVCSNQTPYTWNGLVFNEAGTKTAYLKNSRGCDSAATLVLSVRNRPTTTRNDTICSNQFPYKFDSTHTYYWGEYPKTDTFHIITNTGCDSLFILKIVVKDTTKSTLNAQFCIGKTYSITVKGVNYSYTAAGVYTIKTTNKAGCDSVITLNLTNYPIIPITNSIKYACQGDTVWLRTKPYLNVTGYIYDTLASKKGCDSIIQYRVSYYSKTSSISTIHKCDNEMPFVWNGKIYTSSSIDSLHLKNSYNCDSVAYLLLTVSAPTASNQDSSICPNALPFYWNGLVFNGAGTKTKTHLTNSKGCDSTATLHLSIKPVSTSTTIANICRTCSYTFNGTTYAIAGTYTDTLTNSVGCDSIAVLILTVGQIGGDTLVCKTDTNAYTILHPQNNTHYQWSVSGGYVVGSDTVNPVRIKFDSTTHTYVTLTATNSTGVLYSDTLYIHVGNTPTPKLATAGGVGCQKYGDTTSNDLGELIYIIDTSGNGGCPNVCEKSEVVYYAVRNNNVNSTFKWVVSGGTVVNANADSARVRWGSSSLGTGSITLVETTVFGCKDSINYCFTIINSPIANIYTVDGKKDTITVCRGQQVLLIDSSKATGSSVIQHWNWNLGNGQPPVTATTPHSNPNVTYTTTGYHTVILEVVNACNCKSYDTLVVFVNSDTGVHIICERTVCENSTQFYSLDIPNIAGCNLDSGWQVIGGSIVTSYGNAIEVKWDSIGSSGFGIVRFNASVCPYLCPGTSAIQIGVIQNNAKIAGDSTLCGGETTLYYLPAWNNASYSWSVSGNAILNATGNPNQVQLTTLSGATGTIILTCHYNHNIDSCSGDATLNIALLPKPIITGDIKACVNDTVVYTVANTNGSNWHWQIITPDANEITLVADTLHYVPTQSGTYTIAVVGAGLCGNSAIKLLVNALPAPPMAIVGKDSVCATELYTYSVDTAKTGLSYVWNVTGQSSIVGLNIGNSVNVRFTGNNATALNATINVKAMNSAGCSSIVVTDTIRKLVVSATIIADSIACPDTRPLYVASFEDGDTYDWSVSPVGAGSVDSGNGGKAVRILWNHLYTGGSATVRVSINKCGNRSNTLKTISIVAAPTISLVFDTAICLKQSLHLQINSSVGATMGTVLWSFGDGDTKTTTGNTTSYTYTNPIATPTNYPITAKVSSIQYLGCTYTDAILIKQEINNGVIKVNPTPQVSISPVIRYTIPVGGSANIPLTTSFNPAYGAVDSLLWMMPTGTISCMSPFTCSNQIATIVGSYYAIAKNNYGCAATSDVTKIVENVSGPCGIANIDIIGDTIVVCGTTHLQANWAGAANQGAWWLGANVIGNANVVDYSFEKAGVYYVDYDGAYFDSSLNSCMLGSKRIKQIVPIVGRLNYTQQCNTAKNGYVITIGNYSNVLDGVSIQGYDFYIDGSLKHTSTHYEYKDSSLSVGNNHTAYIVIRYTFNGTAYTCTTNTETLTLPEIPTANFTISNLHCEKIPIQFTYNGTYNSAFSYFWKFDDGAQVIVQDPVRVYQYSNVSPTRLPSLETSNGKGCVVTSSISLQIKQNNLNGRLDPDANHLICPNTVLPIFYTLLSFGGQASTPPTSYTWYDARRTNFQTPITTTLNNTYPAANGAYWVHVEDIDGCYANILNKVVVIPAQIETPRITTSPALGNTDTLDVCVSNVFTLNATLNNNTNVLDYYWFDGATQIGGGSGAASSSITIAASSLTVGQVYAYSVKTLNNIGGTQNCEMTSKIIYVRVNAAPDKPVIQAPTALDCNNYTIGLTATNTTTGIFSWSTGYTSIPNVTTSSTTVNQGGIYIVTFTSGLQCSSSDTILLQNSAKDYFSTLAKGCYKLCVKDSGLLLPLSTPSTSFVSWQWLMNWQPYSGGFNSQVQPLTILNSGTYTLVANNGLCTDTAYNALLEISQPSNCLKEQSCNFSVGVNTVNWGATHDTVYIDFSINNGNGQPIAFTLNALVTGGLVNGGIAQPGTHTYTVPFVMPAGGASTCDFVFTFNYSFLNVVDTCTRRVEVCLDDCLPRPSKNIVQHKQQIVPSYLWIYPSIANSITNVSYKFAQSNTKLQQPSINIQRQLFIYNDRGEKIAIYPLQEKGVLQLSVGQLPKGLYLVQLVENGIMVQTEKLMIVR